MLATVLPLRHTGIAGLLQLTAGLRLLVQALIYHNLQVIFQHLHLRKGGGRGSGGAGAGMMQSPGPVRAIAVQKHSIFSQHYTGQWSHPMHRKLILT